MIVSNIGTWVQNVAQGWLVLQLTDSPLWLGLLGLSFAVPMVLLPLVGGAVADRINRIRLLYVTQTAMMVLSFVVALLVWTDLIRVWHLLAAQYRGRKPITGSFTESGDSSPCYSKEFMVNR